MKIDPDILSNLYSTSHLIWDKADAKADLWRWPIRLVVNLYTVCPVSRDGTLDGKKSTMLWSDVPTWKSTTGLSYTGDKLVQMSKIAWWTCWLINQLSEPILCSKKCVRQLVEITHRYYSASRVHAGKNAVHTVNSHAFVCCLHLVDGTCILQWHKNIFCEVSLVWRLAILPHGYRTQELASFVRNCVLYITRYSTRPLLVSVLSFTHISRQVHCVIWNMIAEPGLRHTYDIHLIVSDNGMQFIRFLDTQGSGIEIQDTRKISFFLISCNKPQGKLTGYRF